MANTNIVDRRKNAKNKGSSIRQKFIKRSSQQIKKAVNDAIEKRKIEDTSSTKKGDNTIIIPAKGIKEPTFKNNNDGDRQYILPGNKDKIVGDLIPKPKKGQGGGGTDGSPDGENEDDFAFTLTREEFLDFFFADLELPDLVKTQLKDTDTISIERVGLTTSGAPTNLNIIRSLQNAIGRRIALQEPYLIEIRKLDKELDAARKNNNKKKILELEVEIKKFQKQVDDIPYIDDVDIRFNAFEAKPSPNTKAIMFCLMDISASMGEREKDLAKRFFMLLYLFLEKNYEKVDIVFIKHHIKAFECNEHDFFHGKESGGTIVSSCLEEMDKIISERYITSDWNIYASQASDGDNSSGDGEKCRSLLRERILPYTQYFAYIQIGRENAYNMWGFHFGESQHQLWNDYLEIAKEHKNFVMDQVDDFKDIYPVFKKLFKKKGIDT